MSIKKTHLILKYLLVLKLIYIQHTASKAIFKIKLTHVITVVIADVYNTLKKIKQT